MVYIGGCTRRGGRGYMLLSNWSFGDTLLYNVLFIIGGCKGYMNVSLIVEVNALLLVLCQFGEVSTYKVEQGYRGLEGDSWFLAVVKC